MADQFLNKQNGEDIVSNVKTYVDEHIQSVKDYADTQLATKQNTLVNQQNIKSLNGNSLLGSGDLKLSTFLPFPLTWNTYSSITDLMYSILIDDSAVKGMAYLGDVTCYDLPFVGNGELKIYILDGSNSENKVIQAELTSGTDAPYFWIYTYWRRNFQTYNSGWVSFIRAGNVTDADINSQAATAGQVLTADGYGYASWQNAASGGVEPTSIAPVFDNTLTYAVGDLVLYENELYRCTTAVTTAGDWTGSTNWTADSVSSELGNKANTTDALMLDTSTQTFTGDKIIITPTYATYTVKAGSNETFSLYSASGSPALRVGNDTYRGIIFQVLDASAHAPFYHSIKLRLGSGYSEPAVFFYHFPLKGGTFAVLKHLAPDFSTGISYAVGDIVNYQSGIYKCITAHQGTWNASHFTEVNLTQIFATPSDIEAKVPDAPSTDGTYVLKCVVSNSGATKTYQWVLES